MNTFIVRACVLLFLTSASILRGQVPQLINYQGRVAVGTANFDGDGQFKFALVSSAAGGAITTYWSNDGTSAAGSQPAGAVTLTVSKGLYSVLLGDTMLTNMSAIPASVFSSADVRLRVWFDDGANGSQLLAPDQRIVAVGYALMAAGVKLPASTNLNEGVITQNDGSLMHTFGTQNFFAGSGAGNFTMTGVGQNTATGQQALSSNTTGNGDTASGYLALLSNTTGYYNTASGHRALLSNTTGSNNTASGVQVLSSNTQGSLNTASGFGALQSNTTGNNNIALGYAAGLSLTTGDNNIDIGNAGVAGESNIIRIGTFQSDTYLTGVIHGNGSALTGLTSSQFTGSMQLSGAAPVGGIISGTNSAIFGSGVVGVSTTGRGVIGTTSTASEFVAGVWGENSASGGTGIVGKAIENESTGVAGIADASGSTGVYGRGAANGVYGTSSSGRGVFGTTNTASVNTAGVWGENSASGGTGIVGRATNSGVGVYGDGGTGTGIKGLASGSAGKGVWGISPDNAGLEGESTRGVGVYGTTTTGYAVLGVSSGSGLAGGFIGDVDLFGSTLFAGLVTADSVTASGNVTSVRGTTSTASPTIAGVWGENSAVTGTGVVGVADASGGTGVFGRGAANGVAGSSTTGRGLFGTTSTASTIVAGVWGENSASGGTGIVGKALSSNSTGVAGVADASGGTGVFGRGTHYGVYATESSGQGIGWAGYFAGPVEVTFGLNVIGPKNFKIDHPLDPANKYLLHAAIESPDVKNLYDGNVTTDDRGEATIVLPGYFEALNRDVRYQLTVIGQFAQAIVASEIANNHFTIKTDKPNVKVSWQVTGIRQDAYMKAHPLVVEQDKPEGERGTYQHPELFGEAEEKGLFWKQNPALAAQLQAERIKREAEAEPTAK